MWHKYRSYAACAAAYTSVIRARRRLAAPAHHGHRGVRHGADAHGPVKVFPRRGDHDRERRVGLARDDSSDGRRTRPHLPAAARAEAEETFRAATRRAWLTHCKGWANGLADALADAGSRDKMHERCTRSQTRSASAYARGAHPSGGSRVHARRYARRARQLHRVISTERPENEGVHDTSMGTHNLSMIGDMPIAQPNTLTLLAFFNLYSDRARRGQDRSCEARHRRSHVPGSRHSHQRGRWHNGGLSLHHATRQVQELPRGGTSVRLQQDKLLQVAQAAARQDSRRAGKRRGWQQHRRRLHGSICAAHGRGDISRSRLVSRGRNHRLPLILLGHRSPSVELDLREVGKPRRDRPRLRPSHHRHQS